MSNGILGVVRVSVNFLKFPNGRDNDYKIVERFNRVFEKTSYNPRDHRISGKITKTELIQILRSLNMTRQELQNTVNSNTIPFFSGYNIRCLDGKHRVVVAKIKNRSATWIVELYQYLDEYNSIFSDLDI